MDVQVHTKGDCERELAISVPREQVTVVYQDVLQRVRKQVKRPGFRQGKVPLDMIRQHYREDIEQEVVRRLVEDNLKEALEQEKLEPLGTPRFHKMQFKEGKPFDFRVSFEVLPDLQIENYKGVEVRKRALQVSEDAIAERLAKLQMKAAEYEAVDDRPAKMGDYVFVDLQGDPVEAEGKPFRREGVAFEIGEGSVLPAFNEAVIGMRVGEEKEVEVDYPEDYQTPVLAGKKVNVRLQVKELKELHLPELDDEFARDQGHENLEGMRAELRPKLEHEDERRIRQEMAEAIFEHLIENNTVVIPSVYEEYFRAHRSGPRDESSASQDEVDPEAREAILQEARTHRILESIAAQEAICVSDDEVDARIQEYADDRGQSFTFVKSQLEGSNRQSTIRSQLKYDKVIDFLLENARIIEEES